MGYILHAPHWVGIEPAIQARALTGNGTLTSWFMDQHRTTKIPPAGLQLLI